jgi:hypothetical protein
MRDKVGQTFSVPKRVFYKFKFTQIQSDRARLERLANKMEATPSITGRRRQSCADARPCSENTNTRNLESLQVQVDGDEADGFMV